MSRRNLQHVRSLIQMGANKESVNLKVEQLFPLQGKRTAQRIASTLAKFAKKVK